MTVSTRMSRYFLKTLREAPAEAELPSHRLLLRAGLVMPLAAGLYCFTPLGWRAMRRVEELVREEMNRAGAQELRLPALQPVELWQQSGRNEIFGDVLYRVSDRRERDFVLAPTHEEAVSALAASQVQSYRDLPVTLYQFQQKFRDEPRPRGGLIRLREFCMKDAYSFDPDWETLDESYQAMFDAYARIFARAEVPAVPVEADSGAIGGKDSQEFIYLNENGEDEVLLCSSCGYAANAEKATFRAEPPVAAEPAPVERVDTPGVGTIASLAAFLNVEERQTVKAVFYAADGEPVFVAIRGDLEVNETKLRNLLKAVELEPMDDAAVARHGLVAGSASPVGLEGMRVVADTSATEAVNLVGGANEPDAHLLNLNYGRDWTATLVGDIALAEGGHRLPQLRGHAGRAVGHGARARVQAGLDLRRGARRSLPRRRGRAAPRGDGLLRHRRRPPAGGDPRGEPRRGRHHLAGDTGAVRRARGRARRGQAGGGGGAGRSWRRRWRRRGWKRSWTTGTSRRGRSSRTRTCWACRSA